MITFRQLKRLKTAHRFRRLCKGLSPRELVHAVRDRFGNKSMVVVVGSAHKVGSTWLDHMLEDLIRPRYDFEGMLTPRALRTLGNSVNLREAEAGRFVKSLRGTWQFKTHRDLHETVRPIVKVISVHRDLRDMCVSATHFGKSLPHDQGGYSASISSQPFKEQLAHELNRTYNLERAEYWWRLEGDLKVKYEDLKADPVSILAQVSDFLEIGCDKDFLNTIVSRHDFQRKAGRPVGQEDTESFLRKGIIGDWKSSFDEQHVQLFKTAKDGRWNSLLMEMGYVNSLDW